MWTTSQFPHVVKVLMGNFVLNIPQHKLRIVAPDVGGGFGVKEFIYAEEIVTTWASRKVNRPVKWSTSGAKGFLSDAHGRDHVSEAELALARTGSYGLKVRTIANMGGYLSTFGPNSTNHYGLLLAGVYTTPAIHCEVKGVLHQHRARGCLSRCPCFPRRPSCSSDCRHRRQRDEDRQGGNPPQEHDRRVARIPTRRR